MRIFSKFQDYYDSALAFGHDEHCVFTRGQVEYVKKENIPSEFDIMEQTHKIYSGVIQGTNKIRYELSNISIAFCGKIYRVVRIRHRKDSRYWEEEQNFVYSFDDLQHYLKEAGAAFEKPPKGNNRYRARDYAREHITCEDGAELVFEDTGTDKHIDFFIVRRLPIVSYEPTISRYAITRGWRRDDYPVGSLYNDSKLTINPVLKQFQFGKLFDAYSAFQELDMFLSGMAVNEDDHMAKISDKDMLIEKGFDCRSFKKEPTKRTPKKCQ